MLYHQLTCIILVFIKFACGSLLQNCTTFDGEPGVCTHFKHCEYFAGQLQNMTNARRMEVLRYAQNQCKASGPTGPRRDLPVCCRNTDEGFPFAKKCPQAATHNVVRGSLVEYHEYAWIALLRYRYLQGNNPNEIVMACAGSLINQRYVLTAAHCLNTPDYGDPISVKLGEYDITTEKDCDTIETFTTCVEKPPQVIAIEEAIPHPDYHRNNDPKVNRLNDIALLRLAQNCEYTQYIRPICMPTREIFEYLVKPNAIVSVAGWGKTEHRDFSNRKMAADLPIVDHIQCSMNRPFAIEKSQICAGGLGKDSCKGDSGGPLSGRYSKDRILGQYLVGIVSFGNTNCGSKNVAAIYTNVFYYIDWITANMYP